ncbi:hypothetical protein EYF80_044617 [Liparis tanakae]|uniref:Uncharacterized protein n=1 Tax=Liparis tanakae TaxID=230148 RepID=A0A4Z2FV77_9TELE|nr:hypothetical protein EYF80_044617 [Liparis tanakae]
MKEPVASRHAAGDSSSLGIVCRSWMRTGGAGRKKKKTLQSRVGSPDVTPAGWGGSDGACYTLPVKVASDDEDEARGALSPEQRWHKQRHGHVLSETRVKCVGGACVSIGECNKVLGGGGRRTGGTEWGNF